MGCWDSKRVWCAGRECPDIEDSLMLSGRQVNKPLKVEHHGDVTSFCADNPNPIPEPRNTIHSSSPTVAKESCERILYDIESRKYPHISVNKMKSYLSPEILEIR